MIEIANSTWWSIATDGDLRVTAQIFSKGEGHVLQIFAEQKIRIEGYTETIDDSGRRMRQPAVKWEKIEMSELPMTLVETISLLRKSVVTKAILRGILIEEKV